MNTKMESVELVRARWRRVRASLALLDPSADGFASAGLVRRVETPSVRLLILPSDPEASLTEFDAAFWEYWSILKDPSAASRYVTWHEAMPTAGAAVRYDRGSEGWSRYLALHRSGALELEMGERGVFTLKGVRGLVRVGDV